MTENDTDDGTASEPMGAPTQPIEDLDDLEDVKNHLDGLLEECMYQIESGRIRDPERERVRIKWIRVTTQVLSERRKLAEDESLRELDEKLREYEERQQSWGGSR